MIPYTWKDINFFIILKEANILFRSSFFQLSTVYISPGVLLLPLAGSLLVSIWGSARSLSSSLVISRCVLIFFTGMKNKEDHIFVCTYYFSATFISISFIVGSQTSGHCWKFDMLTSAILSRLKISYILLLNSVTSLDHVTFSFNKTLLSKDPGCHHLLITLGNPNVFKTVLKYLDYMPNKRFC